MNNENFNIAPNDENEEFTVEFGEVINDGGTHDYNELDNKPQINGHTLEGNKTNEQLGIPVYTEGTGIKLSGDTISADTDVLATKADLNSKQNVIADLPQIRSGAEAGATAVQPEDLATVATSGSYNDLTNNPKINNVELVGNKSLNDLGIQPKGNYALESEIPDVSNFITNTVDNLVNYYKKSETFTKQEVNDLISAITTMDIRVVQTLPTEDISTTTIYFVPKTTAGTNDVYDEYVYVSNAWEHIGSTDIDLSGYQTKIDSSHKLSSDLVDDTNQTNKFVTENEKTTWNTEIENLQEEDELLKRNLQTTTGSGEEVTLDKTAELDFVKPPLPMGNSEQESTTGKNLLRPDGTPTTIRGVSWRYREDGAVVGERVSSNENVSDFTLTASSTFQPGSYIFSCFDTESTPGASTYQSNISINGVSNWKTGNYSFVLNEVSTIRVVLRVYPNFTGTAIFKPMIRLSSIQESNYEPYTGGIPSPSPDYPQEVEVVTGNVGVTISNQNNTESKTLPVSLGNIELCKIGDYQDYIYKNEGNWYVHKNIIKIDLSTITSFIHTSGWRNPTSFVADNIFNHGYSGYTTVASLFCNRLIADTPARITGSVVNAIGLGRNSSIYLSVEGITTSNALITYFSQNPTYLYAPLATPTDTEITDTTLISQLEEISKTLSYQGQTNITSNTIALFDVEAYQSTKLILEDLDLTKLSTFDSTKTQILKNINGSLIWVDE
ncbi:MAG: hypothetical protein IIW92_06395 [Lachnospiraceae bacterium]|nr:hypothetical protein [Lachnospiraceae bacterium]